MLDEPTTNILPFSKIVHTFFSLPLNILRRK